MSKGEALHGLIHKLELNEKRYFKLQSALQKKNSNLSQLFDLLSASEHYDEEQVRAHFKGEKFLEQLAVTQNHLYELILKAMRSYHLKRSIDFKLEAMMQDVQFLYEKGLAQQSQTILRRLRKVAQRHDSFLVLLRVIEWETRMVAEGFFAGSDESDLDALSDEYNEVLGLLQNEREYVDLQFKVFNNYYKIGVERKNEEYKTNDQIMNQFALKDETRALTYRSKLCYLNIHAQYNKINGRWEEAYRYRNELLELVKERFGTSFEPEAAKRYFVAINNLVPICMSLGKFDQVLSLLEELDGIEERSLATHYSIELGQRIRMQGRIGRLALYTRLGRIDEGKAIISEITADMDNVMSYPRNYVILHLYYNMAYFLFTAGNLSEAIKYCNLVLNDSDVKHVEDLHASARLLTMLLQYEVGRKEIMEYLARSTQRFLVRLEGLYPFEALMIEFMRKLSSSKRTTDPVKLYQELREELVKVGYEPGDRNSLSTLDLFAWVDSKLEGRAISEILKEKNDPDRTV